MAKKKITIRKGYGARPGAGAGPIESEPINIVEVDRRPPIWERYEEKPLLDITEVADYLELSAHTVAELLVIGQFPEPLMYDGKRRWSIAAIGDWAQAWPEKKRRLDREWGLPLEDQPEKRGGGIDGLASDRAPQPNRVVMRLYDRASGIRMGHSALRADVSSTGVRPDKKQSA